MTRVLPPTTGIRWTLHPDAIGVITLSRPPVNALNWELKRALLRLIEALDGDGSVRVIVIDSDLERTFCAGSDLYELSADHDRPGAATERTQFEFDLWQRLSALRQPSIAIVEGHALGSGLELAIACDFRIAGTAATFALPEINIGGGPGIQTLARLPLMVGLGPARRMLLLGEAVTAERALDLRLIDEMSPAGDAFATGMRLARHLAGQPESSIRFLKSALSAATEAALAHVAPAVLAGVEDLFLAPQMHEGIQAFLEKRVPDFRGAVRREQDAPSR